MKPRLFTPNTLKTLIAVLITLLFVTVPTVSAANANVDTEIKDLNITPYSAAIKDNISSTYSSVTTLTIKSNTVISHVYVIFWDTPTDCTLSYGDKSYEIQNTFLHQLISIPDGAAGATEVKLTFKNKVNVSDVYAFSAGELPDWVQVWEQPYDRADLLLNTTHADDEQLFFAGILPYYSAKNYRVQVVYFTDHQNYPDRRHELLNGLWTVGIDHYPVISKFPDAYSTSVQWAINNLTASGFTENDALAFHIENLRRFKPQVVVGHDIDGEYGHGQHMLNTKTLIQAVESAQDSTVFPESATKYGTWNTPKLYLHLYKENPIVMNWDEPLERFGGRSAFEVTQDGFGCHYSQHYTWFNGWLNGNYGEISKASQIKTYSPCNYGLYRTTVGNDVNKNDMLENIVSYDEQERIQKELEEQKKREEEESRRLESIAESERLKAESEAQAEAESKAQAEASRQEALEKERLEKEAAEAKRKDTVKKIVVLILLFSIIVTLTALLLTKKKKHK